MGKIIDIMTPQPICLSKHANLHKARMIMADKLIRHIPIVDPDNNKLVGIISQKVVLANAIKIIDQRGFDRLEHEEKSIEIASVMNTTPSRFSVEDKLLVVANELLEQKTGCVTITKNDKVVGIITSKDFIKLAVREFKLEA
ncbi:MAG: CBS domain-containing protein [Kangiellaceae bacterium]|nr:CBS domain-containing protein [Kangiellaceae bacterium]